MLDNVSNKQQDEYSLLPGVLGVTCKKTYTVAESALPPNVYNTVFPQLNTALD